MLRFCSWKIKASYNGFDDSNKVWRTFTKDKEVKHDSEIYYIPGTAMPSSQARVKKKETTKMRQQHVNVS